VSEPFGTRLAAAMAAHGPLVVGVDPHPGLLAAWGLPDTAAGLDSFAATCVAAFAGEVAAIKPQAAFFERHGAAGFAVLERHVAQARDAGLLVVLDAKRGDIGTTVAAYADAYLAPGAPLAVDALTASPYLGVGSLDPLVDAARASGAGLFVLARTSNAEGAGVQDARTPDGATVAQGVLAAVGALNRADGPGGPGGGIGALGSFGAVVGLGGGAAAPSAQALLDVGGPLLVPGLGAQGGSVADVAALAGPAARQVLAAASRSVLAAGPDPAALGAAARALAGELAAALGY